MSSVKFQFQGKTIIVTGAGQGNYIWSLMWW